MTKEGGHQFVGDDIAVDGRVCEALEVFDFIGCCFELNGSGFVLDHGEFQLTGPLSEFTADQLGRFFGGECFHHILSHAQAPAPTKYAVTDPPSPSWMAWPLNSSGSSSSEVTTVNSSVAAS